MRSPKQISGPIPENHSWYRYYAGYSAGFVEDVLSELRLPPKATVLDPWNGAGTTTVVAGHLGYQGVGYDINPALVIIAKARSLGTDAVESLIPLSEEILSQAETTAASLSLTDLGTDPLSSWFTPESVRLFRATERTITRLLVDGVSDVDFRDRHTLDAISSLAAVFYVAAFTATRSFLQSYSTTNPTWIKASRSSASRTTVTAPMLRRSFHSEILRIAQRLCPRPLQDSRMESAPASTVSLCSSRALRLPASSVDAVIASPPYCTRIDYVISTLPELAILNIGGSDVKALRDAMVGTPTMSTDVPTRSETWGPTALTFLEKVASHPSKASSTYYLRYFLQYFASIDASIEELGRVLRPSSPCALVVQDSYYKEVHNDLPSILREIGMQKGFSLMDQHNFNVPRTKAAINSGSRKYRSSFGATESLLVLRSPSNAADR